MPPGLADAVLAVLARDRDVTAAETEAITRLASADDAVAEVQLDAPDGALAPVIGFAAAGTRALLEPLEPLATRALAGWLDAVEPTASHWGAKLGAVRQIYARGRFEAAHAAALAAGERLDTRAPRASLASLVSRAPLSLALARLLITTGADHFAMLGVELDAGTPPRHVGYVAVSGVPPAHALAAARGVSDHLALVAPDPGWLHLSWDLATSSGPFKLDTSARPAGDAIALATALGLDGTALAARLARLALGDPSHVGLRIGAPPSRALALYFRVTAS